MQVAANRRIVVKRFAAGVAHLIVGGAGLVLSLETLPEARVFTVLIVVGGSAALFGLLLRARRHEVLATCRPLERELAGPLRSIQTGVAVGLVMAVTQSATLALAFLLGGSLAVSGLVVGGGLALLSDAWSFSRWERHSRRLVVESHAPLLRRHREESVWYIDVSGL